MFYVINAESYSNACSIIIRGYDVGYKIELLEKQLNRLKLKGLVEELAQNKMIN